jgi:hypothetical protein
MQKLQQLLDQLEARRGNFLGVRWALPILTQLTGATGSAKHDFKLHACPDLLRPLIELMAEWLRRPRIALTHVDASHPRRDGAPHGRRHPDRAQPVGQAAEH